MKHSSYYIYCLGLAVTATLCGCNDLLDEAPDNRTQIDTPNKVKQLMTSAYPTASPAVICELSGDNMVDDNVVVPATHNSAFVNFHDEAFAWQDITNFSTSESDTPYKVWEAYYSGIATCNHALRAIDEMLAKDPSLASELNPYKGEALVTRAYLHFTLVNVFAKAWRNSELSKDDLGIPYVTDPETTVHVDYTRPSVDSVYNCVERDLLAGMPLIDDSYYGVSTYHFNRNAVNAFAARFYLYKRDYAKVLTYATAALGANPSSSLRKWATINQSSATTSLNWYNDETASCNYLIQSTYSLFDRMLTGCRYAVNGVPMSVTTYGSGPCWNSQLPCYSGNLYISKKGQQYGVFLFTINEYFEYTDKIAGIGFVHILYLPFSAEETLLCRAEAKLFLGDQPGCIEDLSAWAASKQCTTELTEARIQSFYTSGKEGFVCELNAEKMSPDFVISPAQKPIVDCILHFRRIETNYQGLRWFDIKRFGIPVTHTYQGPTDANPTTDHLTWDDPRRALQIPNDVIQAGFEANDRVSTVEASSSEGGSNSVLFK